MKSMTVMSRAIAVFSCALCVAPSALAVPTTMTYAGVLTDDGVRMEGTVDVNLTLFDDATAGTSQYSEDYTGVVILDGELIAELGSNALDDAVLELPELWLEITVDGTVLTPRVRLNSVPYALRAEAALLAEEALTLGGILPVDVVTQQQLASLGLQGGLSAGAGIAINAGQISLAAGGVTTSQLADNSVTLAKLGETRGLYQVFAIGCNLAVGTITTLPGCARETGGCPAGQCRDCESNQCATPALGCSVIADHCRNDHIGTILPKVE